MPQELSKYAVGSDGIELSDGAREKFLSEQLHLLHAGHLRSWQGILFQAAALWTIKTKKLYLAAEGIGKDPSFESFADTMGYSTPQRTRYERIGQRMFETIYSQAKKRGERLDPLTYFFKQKDIIEGFEGYFANGMTITMASLSKASKDLNTFQKFLSGELDEVEAQRILAEGTSSPKKLLNAASAADQAALDLERNRAFAKEHGIKYDKERCCFCNLDGSPLTPEQTAEFTLPETALLPWRGVLNGALTLKRQVLEEVRHHGNQYQLFSKYVPNTKFHQDVAHYSKRLRDTLIQLQEMHECLLAMDFEQLERIAKEIPGDEA